MGSIAPSRSDPPQPAALSATKSRPGSRIVMACLFFSGAAALTYETLWIRKASILFGSTAQTTAWVLAIYFCGLALGSIAAARPRTVPIRDYGLLEFCAGIGGLWSLVLFNLCSRPPFDSIVYRAGLPGEVAVLLLAIGPTTILLGATFPILARAAVSGNLVARDGGALYAANTSGAAVGLAAAGFGLPLLISVPWTYAAAAALNCAVGIVAWRLGSGGPKTAPAGEAAAKQPIDSRLKLASFISGVAAMALEMCWIRLFAQVLHNSVYSFTAVALVFIVGIALGGAAAARCLRAGADDRTAAIVLLLGSAATLFGLPLFYLLTGGLKYFGMTAGLGEYVLRIIGLALATAGPAAVVSGFLYTCLWDMAAGRREVQRSISVLGALNMLGCVCGIVLGGLVFPPVLGLRRSFIVIASAYLALSLVFRPRSAIVRLSQAAVLLLIVAADPSRLPLSRAAAADEKILDLSEGASGIVTVAETGGDRQLRLDDYYVLGGSAAAQNERRLGLVPLLLHPAPTQAAFIGIATGISVSGAAALGVPQITAVELVPEVRRAAQTYFTQWNGSVLDAPQTTVVIDDGRHFLRTAGERFDVITSDLFIPWHAGAGSLYTREMYAAVRASLAPGGIFCQWLPMYQLTDREFYIIARTMRESFPSVTIWRNDFFPDRPVVGLVGSDAPQAIEVQAVERRLAAMPSWAADPFLNSARALQMLYVGSLDDIAQRLEGQPVNSDDHPYIEFLAPRLTRISAAGDKDWFIGPRLSEFFHSFDRLGSDNQAKFLPAEGFNDARLAGTLLFDFADFAVRGEHNRAQAVQAEIESLVPDVIDRFNAASETSAADDNLEMLKRQQEELRLKMDAVARKLADEGSN